MKSGKDTFKGRNRLIRCIKTQIFFQYIDRCKYCKFFPQELGAVLATKQGEEKSKEDADNDGTCQGKIKSEIFSFNGNVSGKFAQPGDFGTVEHNQANSNQDEPHYDKCFAKITHCQYPPYDTIAK
jgi:hypothetical protein